MVKEDGPKGFQDKFTYQEMRNVPMDKTMELRPMETAMGVKLRVMRAVLNMATVKVVKRKVA